MKIETKVPLEPKEKALLEKIVREKLPRHIAIIMDGNGRWARARHLPRVMGHRAGARAVRRITEACAELGIDVLTLYAFSTENWQRPPKEISALMRLLEQYLRRELPTMLSNNIRLRSAGNTEKLPRACQDALRAVKEKTAANTGLILNLALNYGGREEIVRAVRALIAENTKHIDEAAVARQLYTAGLPDPDLLIRTSAEYRVSNFLLWQIAYAEFYVTGKFWPDFDRAGLYEALINFQSRDRRFGGVENR